MCNSYAERKVTDGTISRHATQRRDPVIYCPDFEISDNVLTFTPRNINLINISFKGPTTLFES